MARLLISRGVLHAMLFIGVSLMAGCSGGGKAIVKGKISFQGNPVTGYILNMVWAEKGFASILTIGEDGSFSTTDPMEPGAYSAYLSTKPPEQLPPGSKMQKVVSSKVPAKYLDPIKSDLKVPLKSGENNVSLELKD